MSLWDGIFGRRKVKLTDPSGWILDRGTNAGKMVTPDTTLQLSAAWACVRLKSRVVGSLPMLLYERFGNGARRPNRDHWLYGLVHDSPNASQTAAEFWGGMVACMDLWGNAVAEKVPGPRGRVNSLEPLRPEFVNIRRIDGQKVFEYDPPFGTRRTLREDQVLHLKGFSIGGDVGLSAISYGRETLGLALAADETAARVFADGLQVSGFLELSAGMKPTKEQREELVKLFERFAGSHRSGKVMPLEAGWKFVPLSMNPGDAQLLESRAFNVEEICRWFDVMPILIGHASAGQTMWGSGVEQIMLGWLTLDLDPLLTNIEQAVRKQLLPPADRSNFFVEYRREGLLRADSAGRAALLSSLGQNGYLTRNEGRALDNRAPLPGGDVLTVQSNLIPLDQLGKTPPAPSPPGA